MVRIKHRYLLLNFLYPESTTAKGSRSSDPYLALRAPSPSHLSPALLLSHLRSTIQLHFGDCGLGLTTGSLKVIYLSSATSTAIIRCARQHFRIVWAALTFVDEIPGRGAVGKKCVVQVVRVSGTIRKSEEELLRRAKQDVVRAKLAAHGEESTALARLGSGAVNAEANTTSNSSSLFESIDDVDNNDDEIDDNMDDNMDDLSD